MAPPPPQADEGQHGCASSHDCMGPRHMGSAQTIPPMPPRCMQTRPEQHRVPLGSPRPQVWLAVAHIMAGAQVVPATPETHELPGQQLFRARSQFPLGGTHMEPVSVAFGTSRALGTSFALCTSLALGTSIALGTSLGAFGTSGPFGTSIALGTSRPVLPLSVGCTSPPQAPSNAPTAQKREIEMVFISVFPVNE